MSGREAIVYAALFLVAAAAVLIWPRTRWGAARGARRHERVPAPSRPYVPPFPPVVLIGKDAQVREQMKQRAIRECGVPPERIVMAARGAESVVGLDGALVVVGYLGDNPDAHEARREANFRSATHGFRFVSWEALEVEMLRLRAARDIAAIHNAEREG